MRDAIHQQEGSSMEEEIMRDWDARQKERFESRHRELDDAKTPQEAFAIVGSTMSPEEIEQANKEAIMRMMTNFIERVDKWRDQLATTGKTELGGNVIHRSTLENYLLAKAALKKIETDFD